MERKYLLKMLFRFLAIGIIAMGLMIHFSPYESVDGGSKQLICSIDIDAPPHQLFDYLGDSNNAKYWSSYVDHIEALDIDPNMDGMVSSTRRCFKYADETRVYWDEEILEIERNKRRKLSIYNAVGFPLMVRDLRTEQLYDHISEQETRLTFSFYSEPERGSILDELKMYFGAYFVGHAFDANLENIKRLNERSQP